MSTLEKFNLAFNLSDSSLDEKTYAFFDGPNFYASCKEARIDIDYSKLLALLTDSFHFKRAYYYTAMAVEDSETYSPLRPLADYLSYNGYTLVTKPMKTMTDAETGRVRNKGNMDVEIAVNMLQLVAAAEVDHIILFSGDGDFSHLVEAVQNKGVRVTVVSFLGENGHPMIADELRRQADHYVDLTALRDMVSRPLREPREPREFTPREFTPRV